MIGRNLTRIFLVVVLLALIVFIFSLLIGAEWIFTVLLFFSDDTLCEDRNYDRLDDYCEYWDNGQLIRIEWDTNYDGKTDVWRKISPQSEIFSMDTNYDGSVDYEEIDRSGEPLEIKIDSDFDGGFDRREQIRE